MEQRLLVRLLTIALLYGVQAEVLCQLLPLQSYTVKDGLVSHDVQTLYQDSKGYLWIGTTDGISVFDGHEFKNYTVADGLPRGFIRQIIEIREGNSSTMWALTQNGSITRLRDGYFQPFPYQSTARWGNTIRWLGQDHLGTLWAAMEDTLAQIVSDTLRAVSSGIRMTSLGGMFEQGDSLLWFVARSGLVYYSFRTKQFIRMNLGRLDEKIVVDCFLDEEGGLWAGMQGGYLIHIVGKTVVEKRQTPPFDFIVDDRQGSLWFGTYSGLYRLSKNGFAAGQIDHFTVGNGLMENSLKAAFVDREKNLWIGGISKGLSKLSEKHIYTFPLEGTIPTYHYSIGATDSNNHIWVISSNGLWEIWEYPAGRWHKFLTRVEEGQGSSQAYPVFYINNVLVKHTLPYSIFVDHCGRLWIGYSNAQLACYRITPGRDAPSQLHLVRTFRPGIDFPHFFPLCFIVDKHERVWYSTGNGIALLDTKRTPPLLRMFGEREHWPVGSYVRALSADNRGSIWAGFFNRGVEVLDADSILNGSFHQLAIPQVAANERIASIKQDHDGNMCIATETGGLVILQKGIARTVSMKDGLPSNIVTSVIEDMNGRYLVSTNLGVVYLDSIGSTLIHRKSGLFGSSVTCSGTTVSGLLWFVTSDGLITYDPKNEAKSRMPPPAMITRVQVNGTAMAYTDGMELSHNQNNLGIGFIAISFRDDQEIRYQYRMRGIEEEWQPNTRTTSVMYAALPPGEYVFEVKAVGDRGVSGPGQALAISIVPPFWKTWWFTTLTWVTVAVSIGGAIRFIELRKFREQMRALEQHQALDRERLRISHDMHDEVGASLTEIAILSELAKTNLRDESEAQPQVQKIAERSRQVIDNIGEIIWAINPKNDMLDDLLSYIRHHAVQYFTMTAIRCHCEIPEVVPQFHLSAEARRNIFLVVKEALHNVAKHSKATEAAVGFTFAGGKIEVLVQDNGKGFALGGASNFGNGLTNMRKRIEDIGGDFRLQSQPGRGTKVVLTVGLQMVGRNAPNT